MSYYDLDSILTDAQKLPCTFELDVPGLGYLDGNAGGTVKSGTRIDLPLWLGVMLAVSSGNASSSPLISLDFPPPLEQRVTNALKADPRTVNLRSQAPHFYNLASKILEIFEDEGIVDVMLETFRKRAAEIADHANNPKGAIGDGAEFLSGLDEMERQLFRGAHEGPKSVRAWLTELKKQS